MVNHSSLCWIIDLNQKSLIPIVDLTLDPHLLVFGVCSSTLGPWHLDFGPRTSDLGVFCLVLCPWPLVFSIWSLVIGIWSSTFRVRRGCWKRHSRPSTMSIKPSPVDIGRLEPKSGRPTKLLSQPTRSFQLTWVTDWKLCNWLDFVYI